jgi:hypothetical protein
MNEPHVRRGDELTLLDPCGGLGAVEHGDQQAEGTAAEPRAIATLGDGLAHDVQAYSVERGRRLALHAATVAEGPDPRGAGPRSAQWTMSE